LRLLKTGSSPVRIAGHPFTNSFTEVFQALKIQKLGFPSVFLYRATRAEKQLKWDLSSGSANSYISGWTSCQRDWSGTFQTDSPYLAPVLIGKRNESSYLCIKVMLLSGLAGNGINADYSESES
jgi:hypothetical protein